MSDPEARRVRCADCGHEWRSTAKNPRCSKAACGRSRRVRPVDDLDDPQPTDEPDVDETPEQADDDDELDLDEPDPGGGGSSWAPAFKTVEEEVDELPELPDPDPEQADDDEPDDEADDDEADDASRSTDPADAIPEVEPEQLAVAFDVTFDLAARRRGEHWQLDDDEAEQLGKAWAPVANVYLPALLAEHTEIGIAVLATAAIVAPRLAIDRDLKEKAEQQERADADGEPGEVREAEPVGDSWTPPEERDEQLGEQPDASSDSETGAYAHV